MVAGNALTGRLFGGRFSRCRCPRNYAENKYRARGLEYDRLYPEGLPTCVSITHSRLGELDSDRILFPLGHAHSDLEKTRTFVDEKFRRLVAGAVESPQFIQRHLCLTNAPPDHVANLYSFRLVLAGKNT